MSQPTHRSTTSSFPRLALVGCGAAAKEFYLPLLAGFPEFRSTGVLVDRSLSRAQDVANEFGVAQWCDDHESLPISVDAAIITTPHKFHAPQAIHFLRQGKHVFVEKPLAMDHGQAREIVDAASASGAIAMVNNYRRLFPSYVRVRELIQSGRIGSIRRITIQDGSEFAWNSASAFYLRDPETRGVFLDRGAHTVDVLCWWLGGLPTVKRARHDARDGVEAVMDVELDFQDAPIHLKFSRLYRLANRYQIEGEHATIEGRLFDLGQLQIVEGDRTTKVAVGATKPHSHYAWDLVGNFLRAIQGQEATLFTAEDVAPSIGLIDEAYQLAERCSSPWYDDDPNIQQLRQR